MAVKDKKCIFIGGKQLGVNCLKQLITKEIKPDLVIPNTDDDGIKKLWHDSLVKISQENGLNTLIGMRLSDPMVINQIKSINPEIIFCLGGTQIVPEDILRVPTLGCLNIHPALLPKYRGRYSTVQALFNGEKYTGVTLHWMDKGMDTGPIIMQEKILIESNDTAKTLYDKFTALGEKLFSEFLDIWQSNSEIKSRPQDEKKATSFPKMLPNNGEIDWSWDGEKIRNFIRAMTFEPFPPVSFMLGDKKMVIIDEKYFKGFNPD
jgi:methionyl-tRNA formyltransferase